MRMQLMHEYVQKSRSTTFPRSRAIDSGRSPGVLSQCVDLTELGRRLRSRERFPVAVRGGERVRSPSKIGKAGARVHVSSTCFCSRVV